ncbi:hypothetical protein POM88_047268 [Heracleum sosnowskyi]|uniref:Endonuclease/exonuclease/phosphatase domain-containing protein n=1 Tax=Heracleum sosnowskyi TaxID=360622 RepID=A0AAD8GTE3_9APIA|nr:hypothetical protein POM88_047268 [Heracleum sosnowskyi]
MSLLVWNCRGLANPRTIRFLKEIVKHNRPSLIFLSETLVKKNKVDQFCKSIHYAGSFAVESQGRGGGLALIWKNEGGVEIKGSCNHYIDFEVYCEQVGRWRYTGYYGCPERSRRRESWRMLRELASRSNLPWCVIGDFNDMMFVNEKRGGRVQPRWLLDGFSEAVNACGLVDLGFKGCEFTWERSRGNTEWVQERLDRGLANKGWRSLFPEAEVQVLEVSTSDHLPLLLQLKRMVYVKKKKRFRFENMWIQEEECYSLIYNS